MLHDGTGDADLREQAQEGIPDGPVTETHLRGLSVDEANDLIRKDSVWPQPDWSEMVAAGTSPQAAALIKLVRDRLPVRPNYRTRQFGTHFSISTEREPARIQSDYVRMLGMVRDRLMACRTPDDVRAARAQVLADAGWTENPDPETRHLVESVWKDRQDRLQLDYRDGLASDRMVAEGWPGSPAPPWRKGYAVRDDGEGGYLLVRGVRIEQDGFLTQDAAWDWLKAQIEEKRAGAAQAPIPSRPAIDAPLRSGLPDWRQGRDVDLLEFLDVFGLRSVQFGKYVPQAERDELLNRAYDSLYDLAAALEFPVSAIGLGGTLELSFGARSSGSAGADYDPRVRVIALPRASGAGEMARCWAKAFDHWAGEARLSPSPVVSLVPRLATGRGARGREPIPETAHLSPAEAVAWWRVHLAVWRRDPEAAADALSSRQRVIEAEAEIAVTGRKRDAFLKAHPEAAATPKGAEYLDQVAQWLADRKGRVLPVLADRLRATETRSAAAGESAYAAEARRLCGRDGDYWLRPTEIFARAFEACVADRLGAMGGRSDFLVHGVEENRFASGFRGNPYPCGAERNTISTAVFALVGEMVYRLAPAGPADGPGEPPVAQDAAAPAFASGRRKR